MKAGEMSLGSTGPTPRSAVTWSGTPPQPVPFHAEAIKSGLQEKTLGGLVDLHARSWWVILLDTGQLTISGTGATISVSGPALLWLPWNRNQRLRAKAGTVGGHLVMGETSLANAIGVKPEAADLRVLSETALQLALDGKPALHRDIARCFDLILREAKDQGLGSATIIEAQVRVILVMLWRHSTRPDGLHRASVGIPRLLQQFRQTLETHFRDRWTVAQYAEALNVSTDRLHDVCRRNLGKTPSRLIHERLGYESKVLLERSSMTLDQISEFLGFRSAAQFSNFFNTLHGVRPGAWRRAISSTDKTTVAEAAKSYADWP